MDKKPLFLLIAAAILLFFAVLWADIPGLYKFLIIFAEMAIVSNLLVKNFNFSGEIGMVLLKGKYGLKTIENIAKHEEIWKFFSDVGITMSYGLLSYFLMRKNVSWKSMIVGLLMLSFLSFVVAPFVLPFLSETIKVGVLETSKKEFSGMEGFAQLYLALLYAGGFFLILLLSIVLYSIVIIAKLISTFVYGTGEIYHAAPGATLILPGINIPLFEGIIALGIILVVHEGCHAILARIAKIPVLSSGIVLFGIIPVGAFVEPDEEKLKKLEQTKQTRVLVAGSTANLVTSTIAFVIFLLFVFSVNSFGLKEIVPLGFLTFVRTILGLTFALNFVIGTVNILPLPFFDGYRLLELNVHNKMVVKAVMSLVLVAFLINLLPNLFVR